MSEKFQPIKFPRDEQAHNHVIEWWYFNGHLMDGKGNRYAFMNCLFRADAKKVKIPFFSRIPVKILYFYHAVLSDLKRRKFFPSVDEISVVSQDSFSKPLLFINHTTPIVINGYTNRVLEETAPFKYHLKDENLDLQMTATKKPLLEGGNGYIDVHSKKSYYYSLTSLKTAGKIRIKGKWIKISGQSWMDHQWANTKYTQDKWTWFSIQLSGGRELVCYEYDDGKVKSRLAGISHADGKTEHFDRVQLKPLGRTWTSPKTNATYPLDWNIRIPGKAIDLTVKPLINTQELIFGTINYWEGPLAVSGIFEGKKVSGQGFMELVGYPSNYDNIQYARDQLMKLAGGIFMFTKKKFRNRK